MRKLALVLLAIVFFAGTASAWTISWNASTGVDGYKLFWKDLSATTFSEVDVGTDVSYDLTPLNLAVGTRYEFYLTAHSQGSTSAESDHLRWTVPVIPIVVELPDSPQRLVIEF
jgi:hypothetical protein